MMPLSDSEARIQISFVPQINDHTCGHACLSMVTGVPIDELNRRFGAAPISEVEEAVILTELGILPVALTTSGGLAGLPYVGFYFVTVPSLNRLGLAHRIVIEATPETWNVYDPQFGRAERQAHPIDAGNGGTPKLRHWSEVVFLLPLTMHRGSEERLKLYMDRL